MTQRIRRHRFSGNSLMEYALPLATILVTAGLLATVVDINDILGQYFMSASGHDKSSLSGTTFKVTGIASDASGHLSNGASGFSNFGHLSDGGGGVVYSDSQGSFYDGAISRDARPQTLGGNGDRLYAIQGKGAMYDLAAKLQSEGAPQEYVSRVLQGAMTTEMLSRSKGSVNVGDMSALTASLRAQLASNISYSSSHMNEVLAHGGTDGVGIWSGAMNGSIQNSNDIGAAANAMMDGMSAGRKAQYDALMQDGAMKDKISAAMQACSTSGADCANSNLPELQNLADALASMHGPGSLTAEQVYSQMVNSAQDASTQLMAEDKTNDYINQNLTLTLPDAEKNYTAGLGGDAAAATPTTP